MPTSFISRSDETTLRLERRALTLRNDSKCLVPQDATLSAREALDEPLDPKVASAARVSALLLDIPLQAAVHMYYNWSYVRLGIDRVARFGTTARSIPAKAADVLLRETLSEVRDVCLNANTRGVIVRIVWSLWFDLTVNIMGELRREADTA